MYKYYERKKKKKKTPKGVLNTIYRNQLTKQKRKGIKVKYTFEEFKNKYLKDSKYLKLYENWVKSGYLSDYKPSFDRIDSKKDYSFDNLQIITWKENNDKGRKEKSKKVKQYDLKGNYIKTFNSVVEASKEVNVYKSNISSCCKGKLKTSAGYEWKYEKE